MNQSTITETQNKQQIIKKTKLTNSERNRSKDGRERRTQKKQSFFLLKCSEPKIRDYKATEMDHTSDLVKGTDPEMNQGWILNENGL